MKKKSDMKQDRGDRNALWTRDEGLEATEQTGPGGNVVLGLKMKRC